MRTFFKMSLISFVLATTLSAKDTNTVDAKIFKDFGFAKNGIKIKNAEDLGSIYHLKGYYRNRPLDIFVTKDKKYFIIGKGFNSKTNEELSFKIDMSKYKDKAAFTVGEGKDEYYVFTDPECPFCKKFEKVVPYLEKHAKFHFYLFPLSFHKHAKSMSRYIFSLPKEKRAEALYKMQVIGNESYKNAKYSEKDFEKTNKILAEQKRIASEVGVNGTPSVFDKNGKSINWTTLASKYSVKLPIDVEGVKYLQKQDAEIVLGKGKEDLYIFTDTECPRCKNVFKSGKVNKLKEKYTMHFFLYPSNKRDSKLKTAYLLNIKDKKQRAKEFEKIMKGKKLSKKDINATKELLKDTKSKIFRYIASAPYVSKKMGIDSVPTAWNKNGKRMEI